MMTQEPEELEEGWAHKHGSPSVGPPERQTPVSMRPWAATGGWARSRGSAEKDCRPESQNAPRAAATQDVPSQEGGGALRFTSGKGDPPTGIPRLPAGPGLSWPPVATEHLR